MRRDAVANANLAGWPAGQVRKVDDQDDVTAGLVTAGLISFTSEPRARRPAKDSEEVPATVEQSPVAD